MYDFRRKRVIKFLRADSHSVDEVADYVVRELGYTEVSPSDETYQTEYSNMRASFLLQYRPELLGDLTEPQRQEIQKCFLHWKNQRFFSVPEEYIVCHYRYNAVVAALPCRLHGFLYPECF